MPQPRIYIDTSSVREGALQELKSAIGDLADFVESHERQIVSYNVFDPEQACRTGDSAHP